MHSRRRFVIALRAAGLLAGIASAASAQSRVNEIWSELDVFWRPAEHQRTFLELSRRTEPEGKEPEGTIGLYQDYLNLPLLYLRAGFRYTGSFGDGSYRESRIVGETTVTAYSSHAVRLLNRSRVEFRWVNSEYSYRLRDRVQLQHVPLDPQGLALAPYVTFEAYYDSRYNTIARIGGRIGSEAHVIGPFSIDLYIARQNNSRSEPKYVNALGLTGRLSY
jgi:hypothetical protein